MSADTDNIRQICRFIIVIKGSKKEIIPSNILTTSTRCPINPACNMARVKCRQYSK